MNNSSTDNQHLSEVYLFEKNLAQKLRDATSERKKLYQDVYREYYEKYPHHPFIEQDTDLINSISTQKQLKLLRPFLNRQSGFAEIGPGTGIVSFEVSKYVKSVFLIDISEAPTKNSDYPNNAKLMLSNGVNLPNELQDLDIIYSNQLMEHLHQDDAKEQLGDIWRALKTGGKYICVTPHRYTGPHDISKHFDDEATCFHLKEYTVTELINLFKEAGFKKIRYYITPKAKLILLPHFLIKLVEALLQPIPPYYRKKISRKLPFRPFFNYCLIGYK